MVCKVSQLSFRVDLLESLDDMVFKDQSLVSNIIVLTLLAMADVTTVPKPCIVLMVAWLVLLYECRHIAHDHFQAFLARRASVTICDAVAVLIHTEIFRMLGKEVTRKKP